MTLKIAYFSYPSLSMFRLEFRVEVNYEETTVKNAWS